MKYPLDSTTFVETINHLVHNDQAKTNLIEKMGDLLIQAMDVAETDEDEWYKDSEALLKDLHSLKMYHESRRFNEANYAKQQGIDYAKAIPVVDNDSDAGAEMSEEELSKHFQEKRKTKKPKEQPKPLNKMSLEEIESWEKQQDNSNDIYKIAARVKNLARGPNMSLTPQGEMLCNSFVHVLKAFYDFADTLEDKDVKIALTGLVRNQEGMPGSLIAAAGAGVTKNKDKQ